MVRKAQGLTRRQLAVRLGPSELTIGGLIKHLAFAEDIWFDHRVAGNEFGDPWAASRLGGRPRLGRSSSAVDDEPEGLLGLYDAACARSRAAVAEVGDLDAVTQFPNRRGRHFSMRWVLLHMIEETARHAGHADLIRESIDGTTGD